MSMAALMQIGALVANFAGEVVEDPEWKRKLKTFGKSALAGLTIGGDLTEMANKAPGTNILVSDKKLSEALKKNPEGIFGGDLKVKNYFNEGATFGEGINKLPESLGGAFKSPTSWNASESIFNFNPGKTKPIPWFL